MTIHSLVKKKKKKGAVFPESVGEVNWMAQEITLSSIQWIYTRVNQKEKKKE